MHNRDGHKEHEEIRNPYYPVTQCGRISVIHDRKSVGIKQYCRRKFDINKSQLPTFRKGLGDYRENADHKAYARQPEHDIFLMSLDQIKHSGSPLPFLPT